MTRFLVFPFRRSVSALSLNCSWLVLLVVWLGLLGPITVAQAAQMVAAWGHNTYGSVGDGTTTHRSLPVGITGKGALAGKTVTQVFTGYFHSFAICSDGTVAAWGLNSYGQLGDGTTSNRALPVNITSKGALAGKTVVRLTGGYYHSLALCSDGSVLAWGRNSENQLGDGTTTNRPLPVDITAQGELAGRTVTQIAAGLYHSLALGSDGTLLGWGRNIEGQLGDGSNSNRALPVKADSSGVLSGKTVSQLVSGYNNSLVLCSDGTLATWGQNNYGQLGNGSNTNRNRPVDITGLGVLAGKTVTQLAAGWQHGFALCSDGTLATWGLNSYGQLGDGTTNNRNLPGAVDSSGALSGKTAIEIHALGYNCLVLCNDNLLVLWGNSGEGEVGDGTTGVNRLLPVNVTQQGVLAGQVMDQIATAAGETFVLTRSPGAPLVSTGAATNLSSSGATLGATVNPLGLVTTAKIEYGLTTNYGSEASLMLAANNGGRDQNVSAGVTGLVPHATYHYRVSASNSAGTAVGEDATFTVPNALPQLTNGGLTLDERTSAPITAALLDASDSDGDEVSFKLTAAPAQGSLQLNGVALEVGGTFTRADIAAGLLTYSHTGAGSDGFDFDVADGFSTTPISFVISVTPVPPTVVSVKRTEGATNPTNAASLDFVVVFSEDVTGVDSSDFIVTSTGTASATVASVTGSGSTYTVTVNGVSGAGMLRLDVLDDDSVLDVTGNALNGGFVVGEIYDVDVVAPTVTIEQAVGQSDPTYLASVSFTVTFSKEVTGFEASDVLLEGTAGATAATVTGSGSTYTVEVSGMTGAGSVIVSVPAGAASDVLGNLSAASTSADNTVSFEPRFAPTAISLNRSSVQEKLPVGSFVGGLSSLDPDANESFTYSIVGGATSEFVIDGATLRTAQSFEEATKNSYDLTLRTTDSLGMFFEQAFTITILETTKPTVGISKPTANQKVAVTAFIGNIISGTAGDNKGVVSVKVRLGRKRNNVNQYWNGSDFEATQFFLNASVTNVGEPSVSWTLDGQLPPAEKMDSGLYDLQVYATDAAGNKSAYATATFNVNTDFTAPTVSLAAPTANAKVLIADFLAGAAYGTATDNQGVASVKVRLSRKNGTANVYWNGTTFVSSQALVDADLSGTTEVNWKLLTKLPPAEKLVAGAYAIAVYAVDGAGNKSATVSSAFSLSTDFVAPEVSISTPAANSLVNINTLGAGSIAGGATDNIGVVSVKVKLQRKRGTVISYWNGSAFTPTVATVDAVFNAGSGTWSYNSAIPASQLDAGAYTVYATALDGAGNTKTSTSRSFNIVGTVSGPTAADTSAGHS